MKRLIIFFCMILFLFSCEQKKTIDLPKETNVENNSSISTDVKVDSKIIEEYPFSMLLSGVKIKQVKGACLDIIKGDGTYNRNITKNNDSIIEMYTNDSKYYVTFCITKEAKGIRLRCKSTDPGLESETAKIWGKYVVKKLGININ